MRSVPAQWVLAIAVLAGSAPSLAQSTASRERQQIAQLQQLLQRLRQENAELQQGKARDLDKARGEAKDALDAQGARLRASTASSQREAQRVSVELAQAREALAQNRAELDKAKAELAKRDAAERSAQAVLASERSGADADRALLGARLRQNTRRADQCEAKHADAMRLAEELIESTERRQLRACEPFTGIWQVREEARIQALRDRLFESRLDVPPPEPRRPAP